VARSSRARLIHLDTHVVCWLFEGRIELLSSAAARAVERGRLEISPMVVLELQYLREIGRILHGPRRIVAALRRDLGMSVSGLAFERVVGRAQGLAWTRDPFDRLIAAHAAVAGARLVTRDDVIRRRFRGALW
jgi:PIN domain nuclease of toxin-antitoxin system